MIPEPFKSAGKGQIRVSCILVPNGGSAPTIEEANGIIAVARTGAGLLTFTLDRNYSKLKSWNFTPKINGNTHTVVQLQGVTQDFAAAAKAVYVVTMQGAPPVAADIAAHAQSRVSIEFIFSESTVG